MKHYSVINIVNIVWKSLACIKLNVSLHFCLSPSRVQFDAGNYLLTKRKTRKSYFSLQLRDKLHKYLHKSNQHKPWVNLH